MSERRASFEHALERLAEALDAPETDLNRDAAIQRFEFSWELAWKAVQEALRADGIDCSSPRSCLREAWRQGWIDDEATWLAMLEDRNRTTHTYDEQLARQVYARLFGYLEPLRHLARSLRTRDASG